MNTRASDGNKQLCFLVFNSTVFVLQCRIHRPVLLFIISWCIGSSSKIVHFMCYMWSFKKRKKTHQPIIRTFHWCLNVFRGPHGPLYGLKSFFYNWSIYVSLSPSEPLINLIFATLITALLLSLAVNVSRSQLLYNSLVNMDVQKDELSQAVQERLLLAPTSSGHSNKERGGPSHLIFMTSDLMRQQPFSSEEGRAKSKLCPLPPSSRSAFDLYRHQKCHEATSWQVCLAPQCFKNKKKIMNIINLTRKMYVKCLGLFHVIKFSEPIIFHGLYCVASQMFTPLSWHIL